MAIASCSISILAESESTGIFEAVGAGISIEISDSRIRFRTGKKLVLGKEYQFKLKPTGEPVEISAFAKVDKIEPDTLNPQLSFIVTLDKGLRDFGNQSESNNQHAQKMIRFIEASATECFEAICDFQAYHVWVKYLQEVKLMGSNPRRPITVKLVFDLLHLKIIEVTNRYTYDEENFKMAWEMKKGTLLAMSGSWIFEELNPQKTLATLEIKVTLGFPAPKKLMDHIKQSTMLFTIKDFKEYVEKNRRH